MSALRLCHAASGSSALCCIKLSPPAYSTETIHQLHHHSTRSIHQFHHHFTKSIHQLHIHHPSKSLLTDGDLLQPRLSYSTQTIHQLHNHPTKSLLTNGDFLQARSPITAQRYNVHHHRERGNLLRFIGVLRSNTLRPNKHYNKDHPMFRVLRGRKFIKIDLPDYSYLHKKEQMTPEEIRSWMKKEGISPNRDWSRERPIHVSCTSSVFDQYVPAEGDGQASFFTADKAGEVKDSGLNIYKNMTNKKKLKKHMDFENWKEKEFAVEAWEIYRKAQEALVNKDNELLHSLVTEKCFPMMWNELKLRSVYWDHVETIEPPRCVHIRTNVAEEGSFCQVTVRFNTKQKLAVYDQFGRLMLGSRDIGRNILEYVVFENHISNKYGQWRIHAKIFPSWLPPQLHPVKTYLKHASN